jgi:hypothetical protein
VLAPFLERYRQNPGRIALLLLYFGILTWTLHWRTALVLTVNTAAMLELRERQNARALRKAVTAILISALYLFVGFLLVLAYNTIIVSARFNFATDAVFNSMDKWLLHGWSVPDLAHWAVRTFPMSFFRFLEFIYFGMFPQIGAAIVLVSVYYGKKRALQFVGTILTAYYFALAIFWLWPSQGPYTQCPAHFSQFPSSLQVYAVQRVSILHALALWKRHPIDRISTDYLIAFPCMHIAQPLIVMWFLRRWKRMLIVLSSYDLLLLGSIFLLEWHYVVDVLGGILVAAIAIYITDGCFRNCRIQVESAERAEVVPSL